MFRGDLFLLFLVPHWAAWASSASGPLGRRNLRSGSRRGEWHDVEFQRLGRVRGREAGLKIGDVSALQSLLVIVAWKVAQ